MDERGSEERGSTTEEDEEMMECWPWPRAISDCLCCVATSVASSKRVAWSQPFVEAIRIVWLLFSFSFFKASADCCLFQAPVRRAASCAWRASSRLLASSSTSETLGTFFFFWFFCCFFSRNLAAAFLSEAVNNASLQRNEILSLKEERKKNEKAFESFKKRKIQIL